jgi:hypothetical protein
VTCAEAGGLSGNVASARGEFSKQRLRHGTAAHIACADEKDMAVFLTHAMRGTLVRRLTKSTRGVWRGHCHETSA